MPPIVRLYRKFIILAAIMLVVFGVVGYTFRSTIQEAFDIRALIQLAELPKEETLDQIQGNTNQPLDENANTNTNGTSNEQELGTTNSSNAGQEEVLGVETKKKPLPAEINIKVPFTTQAPFANWSLPYGEACEEASALMVHFFYQKKQFTKDIADKEIRKLVDFQTKKYGFYKDSTAEQTARFIRDDWGYKKVRVVAATVEGIKQELANGHPVIIPAAGRLLGNPNFRSPGPLYHMLVIKGYTKDGKFITNDPGTRKGANYVYDQKVLLNAIHDWNGGDVNDGKKVMIIIEPNK